MTSSYRYPMPRERNLILALLLILAAASWVILIWQSSITDQLMSGLTMGLSASVFLAIWIVMMVAMMFPTAAPMILMFRQVHAGKRGRGQSFVPTWIFVGAYLVIWGLSGILAYVFAQAVQTLAESSTWFMNNAARFGGVILVLAGLYQFSPLKTSCLSKCRTPLDFILGSWRDGYIGSFRMGLQHGAYCLGCCWLLFLILFPLGIMNVAAMAVITLLIFAEKSLSYGRRIGQIAAVVMLLYGLLVVFVPDILPIMMSGEAI